MRSTYINSTRRMSEIGASLVELLVSLSLIAGTLGLVSSDFLESARRSADQEVIMRTEEQARILLDMLVFDLRMAGSGMPLGQSGFSVADTGLADAPLPILTTATSEFVEFRFSERGQMTILTADHTPSVSNLDFDVLDASGLAVGNTVYLSNMTAGGTDGLRGVITAISGTSVTIDNTYVATPGSTFNTGSTVHVVKSIQFSSSASLSEISRVDGGSTVVLGAGSTFTLSYLDASGTTLTLPMTNANVEDDLATIDLTVNVSSSAPLRDGSTYIAQATQAIMLRNLMLAQ